MLQIVISVLLLQKTEDLRSFEQGPQKHFIWKASAKNGLLSLVVIGEVRFVTLFFGNILQTDLFLVGIFMEIMKFNEMSPLSSPVH